MATANDVAAYVMDVLGRPCSTMKLQKLLYYSQGWSLIWDEEPLFDDAIQAWANGPVVYSVFDNHRGRFRVDEWRYGDVNALTEAQMETVQTVVGFYGKYSGQELSELTHDEAPWLEAREGLSPGQRSQRALSLDTMQDFFGNLATQQ